MRGYGSEHLGYLHCTPHTFYLGPSIGEVIREAGDLLTHVHISDSFRTHRIMDRFGTGVGLHLHLEPGLGEVDFEETFKALKEIGYRGSLGLQLLSHPDTPVESSRRARRYLKEILGKRLAD